MPPNLFAVSLPSLGRLLPQEGQMAAAAPPPPRRSNLARKVVWEGL